MRIFVLKSLNISYSKTKRFVVTLGIKNMEDAENAFNDGIAKMQEALEMVKENCNDVFGIKEEIEELETQAGELEGAGDEINEELKVGFLIKSNPAIL